MNDEDRKIILEDSEDLCRPILERLQEYYDSTNLVQKESVIIDALAVTTYSTIYAISEKYTNPALARGAMIEAFIGILNNLLQEADNRWQNNEEENT